MKQKYKGLRLSKFCGDSNRIFDRPFASSLHGDMIWHYVYFHVCISMFHLQQACIGAYIHCICTCTQLWCFWGFDERFVIHNPTLQCIEIGKNNLFKLCPQRGKKHILNPLIINTPTLSMHTCVVLGPEIHFFWNLVTLYSTAMAVQATPNTRMHIHACT
jgi:hypothetical protein